VSEIQHEWKKKNKNNRTMKNNEASPAPETKAGCELWKLHFWVLSEM
jgi:hypothetical protein